ncbi:hypothetical protein BsWGS_04659 [Bradybaena similaris]
MRNLKLLERRVVRDVKRTSDALVMAVDNDADIVYVATWCKRLIAFCPKTGREVAAISLGEGRNFGDNVPVGLQYLCDQQAVCVAMSDGKLYLWHKADASQLETVGEVDDGITAMSWSPDLEVFVITTGQGKLLLMTREFDVITELPLYPNTEGEDSNIALGWGKKETQFHGSAGKQAAKVEQVLVQPTEENDRGRPFISWRGDGQFFVVSAVDPETRGRFLYIWSRECVFQGRSEPVNGLQDCLSWKPSGALIAAVQLKKHTNTKDVVFFEKNGLRHGEFTIQLNVRHDFGVSSLLWNHDSTVLAVWLVEIFGGCDTRPFHLQLWTVNNYHWYLKQSLIFTCGVSTMSWDTEHAFKMHIVTQDSAYLSYTWAWTTDHTSGSHEQDQCLVGVIDGANVLLTPMRQMVVPPPMAGFTLNLPSPVNCLTFDPSPGANGVACLMSNGAVAIFRHEEAGDSKSDSVNRDAAGFIIHSGLPTLAGIYDIQLHGYSMYPSNVLHFVWLSSNNFLFTTVDDFTSAPMLHCGYLSPDEKVIIVRTSLPVESPVLGVAASEVTKHVAIQLNTGQILRFVPESESLSPWITHAGESVRFPYLCTEMAVTSFEKEEAIVGLTERFRLYVNGLEVASNCTSFGIHNEFILLTTLYHTLRCISRSTQLSELPKFSDGKSHPYDESIRKVERGSRIVAVVGDSTKLVLQMPRGNLETVHPRALVLSSLKHSMDSGKMLEAFLMMRKHRISLNLLHDHNPSYFLAHIDHFVSQINNPGYINVFLTDLTEEDVTKTMYAAAYQRDHSAGTVGQVVSKVDKVCEAFLACFKRLDENRYLQSVLTALVRKTKPELEEALLLVWSLRGKSSDTSAEDALKYLLFLVDVNRLYDVALGTYNFDLVLMVADKSQKDPKEYIPFLNELRRLEENYRYYTIDKHLKKYDKALEHIARCGKEHFEECVSLVTGHKLYTKALRLYKPGTEEYRSLATHYGNYLKTKHRHDEAGIMFLKGEDFESALESFKSASDWRQVFCMATKLEYSGNKLSELAIKVAGDLKSHQRFAEAAIVLEQYAQDPEEALVALLQGSHWEEALRLIHHHKRFDLIETHMKEAIDESWSHQLEMLTAQKEQFEKYKTRLAVVRVEKEKAKTFFFESQADHCDADLFSDTTSMTGTCASSIHTASTSRSTVFTKNTGSARTRRKAENKKWSLKEGSANEEYALVDALSKIIKSVDSLRGEITSLMKILIQFNHDEKACTLQAQYDDLLKLQQASVSEIWTYNQNRLADMNLGPNMTANSIAQAAQEGQRPQKDEERLDPVLLVPPTLNKDTRWKLHIATDER